MRKVGTVMLLIPNYKANLNHNYRVRLFKQSLKTDSKIICDSVNLLLLDSIHLQLYVMTYGSPAVPVEPADCRHGRRHGWGGAILRAERAKKNF